METQQLIDLIFRHLAGIVLGLGGIGIFLLCAIWFIAGVTLVFASENSKTLLVLVLAFIVPLMLTTISYITIINQIIDQAI